MLIYIYIYIFDKVYIYLIRHEPYVTIIQTSKDKLIKCHFLKGKCYFIKPQNITV